MPILALLLMNVPVTEARLDWSEGTKGTFAMVGWIILAIATFSGVVATMVYGYRTLFGHRDIPSEEETSRRLRESTAWLSYIAWIRADLRTARDLEKAAAARVLDLESQLFGVPRPRPLLFKIFSCLFPSKLFRRLFRAAKKGSTTPTSGDASNNRRTRRNKGKASKRRHAPHPYISSDDGTSSGGKNATQKSTSSVNSSRQSGKSTAHGTKSTTTKDGGENSTHGSISSNPAAEKTRGSAQQHILSPPLQAHKATSSKHVDSPTGPAASHHDHVISPIRALYALDPIRPIYPARKTLSTSKHVESSTRSAASHHGHDISPIRALYALDPIRPIYPARKPLPSSSTMPCPYHA